MLILVMNMKSVWQENIKIENTQELKGNEQCDVAVVGAGMAGLLTAYLLMQENKKVMVFEANTIGSGQSGKSTAKITSQHGYIYYDLLQTCGKEKTQQYLDANQSAIEQYEKIINELNIACDFRRCAAYLFSLHNTDKLANEQKALTELGVKTKLYKQCELPCIVQGALQLEKQACFNPMKFMKHLVKKTKMCVYEHTKILDVKEHELLYENGKISANHIVIATHYPIIDFPGLYFMRMRQERSYVLALNNAQQLNGMYYGIDEDTISLRSYQDGLLFGGENHRCGENSAGGRYDNLKRKAHALYPDSKIITKWSAQDCMSLDKIAYIGKYHESNDYMYVATGFNKWGMTTSMVAAHIIKDMIIGRKNPYAEVFSPQRINLVASTMPFLEQSIQSMKSITREYLSIPTATLDELPIHHGGIITIDKQKVGVYKNEEGECFIVDVKCPHLHCQLEWNPDELSWDCPCHGSRFDYRGKLIDNPAQEDLYE